MQRRGFIKSASACALGVAAFGLARPAQAALPQLNIVVPATPGGGWDLTGRSIARMLQESGDVNVVQVENIPGAGGAVALPQFLPRGDRPLSAMVTGFTIVSSAIINGSPQNVADATPLARLSGEGHVLVVPADSPIQTLEECVTRLKDDPKSVSVTGGAPAGSDHCTLGLLALANGIDPLDLNWISYDGGGQAQTAVLGGHVVAAMSNWSEFSGQIKAGRLRALAISSDKPLEGIDVPTFVEQGQDVVLFNWRGIFAPTDISDANRTELEAMIGRMAQSEAWKAELARQNWIDLYLPAAEFAPVLEQEIASVGALLKQLGFA